MRMSFLNLPFIVFFLLIKNTLGLNDSMFIPQGCSYKNGVAICDFRHWLPPLLDKDFNPEPLHGLKLKYINGTIPAGAFSGLNGPLAKKHTAIDLYCDSDKTTLSRDIFTSNLHWLRDLLIINCHLENGLPSRLLENLQDLKYLIIMGGKISGLVANDTLSGLANLQGIAINSPVTNGKLPFGLFNGLHNLTIIDLKQTGLKCIPSHWFNGLNSLEQINLSNNNLQTLPSELFDESRILTQVSLQNNPWNCSCELKWLLEWSHITDTVVCQHPSDLISVELKDAFKVLDCTSSTPTVLSTPASSETKVSEAWTTYLTTIAATGSVSNNRGKGDDVANNLHAIVLFSVFGALAVLISIGAVLYLSVCRHICIGSLNPVRNREENSHDSDHQDTEERN